MASNSIKINNIVSILRDKMRKTLLKLVWHRDDLFIYCLKALRTLEHQTEAHHPETKKTSAYVVGIAVHV